MKTCWTRWTLLLMTTVTQPKEESPNSEYEDTSAVFKAAGGALQDIVMSSPSSYDGAGDQENRDTISNHSDPADLDNNGNYDGTAGTMMNDDLFKPQRLEPQLETR